MDTKSHSTSAASLIAPKEEQGFFKKYKGGLLPTGMITTFCAASYALLTLMTGIIIMDNSEIYEHHTPRAVEQRLQNRRGNTHAGKLDKLAEKAEPYFMSILKSTETPWRMMGYVMPEHYKEAREKTFKIAGIEENNPSHDAKRFELYRQLGFAVLRADDGNRGVYIPFSVWKDFVERNSLYADPKWNQLRESPSRSGGKYGGLLLGRVFHKADSKSQGGNEDGVVDDAEWNRALKEMGHTTVDDIVDKIIKMIKADSPELKEELGEEVRKVQESNKIANFMTRIPMQTLESYLQMK